jgi:carbazole 1,9a-dioxygenase terminal dioxygenase component
MLVEKWVTLPKEGGIMEEMLNTQTVRQAWRAYYEADLGFWNHWYPAAWSHEVGEDPKPVKLLGERILLRRIDGRVWAIEDRCPHRRVPFSAKIECYTKDTITCWYHGWTVDFTTGELVQILTEPGSALIGKVRVKTYPVQEAQGLVFLFLGDIEPPPLSEDVPPGFLDPGVAMAGLVREVRSNWRWGAENGFDTTHVYIHRHSKLLKGARRVFPLGFVPSARYAVEIVEGPGPKGVIDRLTENYIPHFEASIKGTVVSARVVPNPRPVPPPTVSMWLPCWLKVDPWPVEDMIQYEAYVPKEKNTHWYWQVLAKRVESEQEAMIFREEVSALWEDLALRGFNNDDIWAREALEDAYTEGEGWTKERLFKPDLCIVEWRKLASRCNRGIRR